MVQIVNSKASAPENKRNYSKKEGSGILDGDGIAEDRWRVNVQRIKDLITGGFEPFIIRMSDGKSYDVPHPEFVAVGQGVVVVIESNDRVNTLDPRHITAIGKKFFAEGGA